MTTILDLTFLRDPRNLQVNVRFKGGHFIPNRIREEMQHVQNAVVDYIQLSGWKPSKHTYYRVTIWVCFPTMSSDIDGPVKRLVDSVFRGLRAETGQSEANDSRVLELKVYKYSKRDAQFYRILVEELDNLGVP